MLLSGDTANIPSLIQERTQVILERLVPKDTNITFAITGQDEEEYWIEEVVPKDYFRKLSKCLGIMLMCSSLLYTIDDISVAQSQSE